MSTNTVPLVAIPTDPNNPTVPPGAMLPPNVIPVLAAPTPMAPFHSASLYVGDLAPDCTEGHLFEIFNAVVPVASIRICRDAVTRRSLGYAYVNFHQSADAERVLDTMNYTEIKGRPCRIMWSQRDPSLRRSGVGNIFVKNLHESIDNKQLFDTFSLFGNILSCKVVTDKETGGSKGYGYIHYETDEAARAAIEKLDGMLIDGQEVQVGEFMRRTDRPGLSDWTNCYVKNIPYEWDDEKLYDLFSKYGEIFSAAISRGRKKDEKQRKKAAEDGEEEEKAQEPTEEKTDEIVSLGYGFVNFVEHESAAQAVEELNGIELETMIDGEPVKQELFVGRAQKRAERERELRSKFEAEKMDRLNKNQGVNLFVKNLDDSITDDILREEFSIIGTITSARIMKDAKTDLSRGFGFVCYSTQEEATRAVNELNGKLIAGKPIFVALAQRKEVRRAQLEAQFSQRAAGGVPGQPMMRGPMGAPMGYPGMGMYMRPGPGGSMQPAYPMMPPMMGGPGAAGGRGAMPGGRGGYAMMNRGMYPMPVYGGAMAQQQPQQPGRGMGGRGGPMNNQGGRGQGRGGGRGGPMQQGRGGLTMQPQAGIPGRGIMPQQPGIKFNPQARNAGPMVGAPGGPMMPPQQAMVQPVPPQPQEPLTAAALASASPEIQKNMIGERIYPLIHQSQPELAGKITGMLLEMDNSELLHLLESPEALNVKISEAIHVLETHKHALGGQ